MILSKMMVFKSNGDTFMKKLLIYLYEETNDTYIKQAMILILRNQ